VTRALRTLAAIASVAGTLVAVAPVQAADEALRLTPVRATPFPHRSFVLTIPSGTTVDAANIGIRENGREVSRLSVVPVQDVGKKLATVLVIDASHSMRGEPIGAAMEAARAFAERRNGEERLGVVLFGGDSSVALPLTTDEGAIDAALGEAPALTRGTRLYDGVATALELLAKAKVAAGSIVVLSDGRDTGSAAEPSSVAASAKRVGVRIFSVGLRSRQFTTAPLEELATASGGAYSEARAASDLAPIFDAIGADLANDYFLRYRSLSSGDARVHVEVTVDGSAVGATSEYRAPKLPEDAAPYQRPLSDVFWRSSASMLVVAAISAAFLLVGAIALLVPRRRDLRGRMSEFVSLTVPADERRQRPQRPESPLAGAEKSVEHTRWWGRFVAQLELAEIRMPPAQIAGATIVATLTAALLLYAVLGALFTALALAIPFVVRSVVVRKVQKRRAAFAEQLPDNLQVLASALRAGHSLVGALSVVVDDAPEPARSEFRRIIADEQLGVRLEEAFATVVARMDSRDLEQVALVAALQRETGGNTAEVLDRVCDTIRERFELRRLVNTLTAQGRMSRWVVSLLPVGLLFLITLLNPAYMKPLYTNPLGRVMLLVALVMVVAGSFVIKKIVNIKV
jgi:tight adherence protein B